MDNFLSYKGDAVRPEFSTYEYGNSIALGLFDEYGRLYSVPTVNITTSKLSNERCAFLDTNNCGDGIVNWLERNNFGKVTGRYVPSGFCSYPEFEFTQEALDKYKNKDIQDLLEEVDI